jgi:hypothetical protein
MIPLKINETYVYKNAFRFGLYKSIWCERALKINDDDFSPALWPQLLTNFGVRRFICTFGVVDELFEERWNSDMANPKGLAFGLLSINFPGFAFDSFVEDEFTLVQAIERHTLELNSWPKTRIEFVEAFECLVRTGEKFRGVRLSSFLLGDKAKSFQKHILERGDSNRE